MRMSAFRRCAGEGCNTILSRYTKGKLCSSCQSGVAAANFKKGEEEAIRAEPLTVLDPEVERVIKAVSTVYKIPFGALLVRDSTTEVMQARHVASYLLRTELKMPFPAIGDCFKKTHATIMHSCRKVEELCVESVAFRTELETLRRKIKSPA